MNATN